MPEVSVAIPVRDGGERFAAVLDALARQTVGHELLVCDSGSSDGSRELARARAHTLIEIAPREFNHGAVRNRLLAAAGGAHVALLSQDAEPADSRWLERLLAGFELADDVALVYGPYRPRADAPVPVRLELDRWFASLSPDGEAQVARLEEHERSAPARALVGRAGFFSDANACIARGAWERVPFREVSYAEDRVLAIDMLRAGYAKVFMPQAAVLHSHHYSSAQQLRRSFDEWRALREIYGWREPASPAHVLGQLRGELAQARRQLLADGVPRARGLGVLTAVARHHLASRAGAVLGSRAERLPRPARRALSLDGRSGFEALELDSPAPPDPTRARAR